MELLLKIDVIAKGIYFLDMHVRTVEVWLLRGVTELHLVSYFEIGSPYNIACYITFFIPILMIDFHIQIFTSYSKNFCEQSISSITSLE